MKKSNKPTPEQVKSMRGALEHASYRQLFVMLWWEIFYPNKFQLIHELVGKGMHFPFAFGEAKLLKS